MKGGGRNMASSTPQVIDLKWSLWIPQGNNWEASIPIKGFIYNNFNTIREQWKVARQIKIYKNLKG